MTVVAENLGDPCLPHVRDAKCVLEIQRRIRGEEIECFQIDRLTSEAQSPHPEIWRESSPNLGVAHPIGRARGKDVRHFRDDRFARGDLHLAAVYLLQNVFTSSGFDQVVVGERPNEEIGIDLSHDCRISRTVRAAFSSFANRESSSKSSGR